MTRKLSDSLNDLIYGIINGIWVEKPCKVVKVHSPYRVDIEYYDKDESDILYNVPVKIFQTANAYFYLKINVGDRGTVRFLDNCFLKYLKNFDVNSDLIYKNHSIQNGIFVLGFLPEKEEYEFANGEISIGTKNGTLITLNNDCVTITGGNIVLSGTTTIEGKKFLNHTHSNGNEGAPTGGVL